MIIQFFGAVRTVTGSMHLMEVNGSKILLDCGLYQGKRKEAFELNRNFPFDPATIDMLILSHAHIDHSGNIPTLVKKGFRGKIFATSATVDLCEIMLLDSAHIQERDVEYVNKKRLKQGKNPFEPLYTQDDTRKAMEFFVPVNYEQLIQIAHNVEVSFHDAGHLLGSAVTTFNINENGSIKRVCFTGDLGRKNMPIIKDPTPIKEADYLITESTYGNSLHPKEENVKSHLAKLILKISAEKGKLIIPAFSVGRTQTVVYFLNQLYHEGRIPDIPVFVDSPLSTKATEVFINHDDCFDMDTLQLMLSGTEPFTFKTLKYVTEVEDSKKINNMEGPAIIISASGMCESGRILHHLAHNISNEHNIILIIGHQAENTLGRKLVEGVNPVKIFGEEYWVSANVEVIEALSAHADRNEFIEYFDNIETKIQTAFIVHGELSESEAFADLIKNRYNCNTIVPNLRERFQI